MTPLDAFLRLAIVTEARSWLGTPYHSAAGVKGVGVDCAYYLLRVFERVGCMPSGVTLPRYKAGLALLRKGEKMYLEMIQTFGRRALNRGPNGNEAPQPGDVVVFRFVQCTHGAIVEQWPVVLHAFAFAGAVVRSVATDPYLGKRWESTWVAQRCDI